MKEISKEKITCIKKIVDKWLGYQIYINGIPGASIGIVYKDKIIFKKGYGFSNLENKEKATENTCYRIASNSKLFTAIAIMQLVESGKINLDDPFVKHISWLENNKSPLGKVTIRQLLTHSSGIERDGDTDHWTSDKFPEIKRIKNHISKGIIVYPPIEKFKYSNLGYSLLGELISEISGISYEQYVKNNILKKIGLENTSPDINQAILKKLATGYGRDIPGFEREKFSNPSTQAMAPATGFVSNVEDLCKVLSAQFYNNKLLKKETKKEMQRIQWTEENENEKITWGLGYEIWKTEDLTLCGHGGGFPGFITRIAFDKNKEIGVVVLTNCIGGNAFEITNGIFNIINHILKEYESYAPIKEKSLDLKKFEGRFYGRYGDDEIVEINNSLNIFYPIFNRPMSGVSKLKHKKGNVFTIETGDNFGYIGEEVIFEFKENKVKRVKIGQSYCTPFEEKIKKNVKRTTF